VARVRDPGATGAAGTGTEELTIRVYALVTDLMDRSRIGAAIPGTEFVRDVDSCGPADVVIVDLAKFGSIVPSVRAAAPTARVVCFGPHVDDASAEAARAAGAHAVMPRSRFFRDPLAAVEE